MNARRPAATRGHAGGNGSGPHAAHRLVVTLATWLTESDRLILASLPTRIAAAAAKHASSPGEARVLALPPRTGETARGTTRVLIHWPADGPLRARTRLPGFPSVEVSAQDLAGNAATTRDFAREGLAWLDAGTRSEVLNFVVTAATARAARQKRSPRKAIHSAVDAEIRVSATLYELREALRERLPVGIVQDGPVALIDAVARVDRDAFYMRGRVGVGASRLARMTAVTPEAGRIELLDRAYWYELAALAEQRSTTAWKGFSVFFTCPPSLRPGGWLVELEAESGDALEVGAPQVVTDAADVIRTILEDLSVEPLPATRLRTKQVVPAVRRLQRARHRSATLEKVKQFGAAPRGPAVSVIVPLYRRIDLIEHQMTQFADDLGMQTVDLIYVLDSPELESELVGLARRLFPLYRQPFRVAVVSANVGFAGANNLGASIAKGRLLLLLNSDVFPESPGWLDAMVRFYNDLPNAGAVGPKLLYEDDTIQHAGMFFERLGEAQPWSNEHYFKGMHRDLPAASMSRPVPAVTGACLMVARDLYLSLGGLSGDYLQGDFEDSEFCLRLLEAGRQNWYFADVALYHLEAASYDPDRRRVHDGFNRWLHTHLWADRLSAVGGPGLPRIAANASAGATAAHIDAQDAAQAMSGN